ncbi:MAG TPA: HPF/RaiA family ribosome-associated protein [Candidatus Nanoarchaeia archaeon]|nr:HPF/RaiA family ribosome-associated protein [Candidatus Nanoarchaeia archaeon]
MDDIIRYSGINDLSDDEQVMLRSIIEKEFPKLKRYIKNNIDIMVHVKVLKKESRKRYNINLRIDAPTRVFSEHNQDTEKGGDWDLIKSAHKAVKALENEVKHRFKAEDKKKWKFGGIKRFFSNE